MTNTDTLDDFEFDPEIEALLDKVLGSSYFGKPKSSARLLNISDSTFYRGAAAGVIETVPHSGGLAVPRHVLKRLMKYGIPRIPSVVSRKRA